MAHGFNDTAVFGPHGSNRSSPSCDYKYVLSADEAKHENIQDKQHLDVCVSREAIACFITKSNRRVRDFASSSLCISHSRPLPIVDSEGESESVKIDKVTGLMQQSTSNTACVPQRLTVYSRSSTVTTVLCVLVCNARALSGRLMRSTLHGLHSGG